ncbi:amidohydrolase [Nitrospirillum amazonense]|uniref:amidohydrolase n=1 Tax=Nitrospirillum amazonense TaxID=28077 RepID=UPI002DD4500A|nr:amidohydrolase [Nitrospirillum amazonense]MEC4592607.1 amidohydrolase [Nitrospirillum amazonense]
MKRHHRVVPLVAALALLGACASSAHQDTSSAPASDKGKDKPVYAGLDPADDKNPFPSTYHPLPSVATALVGATIFTGTGARIDGGTVVLLDGKIAAVGKDIPVPAGAKVIDAHGKYVTPGIIDAHSHLGVYATPSVWANSDGNEMTDPNTAQVWAEHSVWPQDPGFIRALEGGITTLEILPGSANLFGGRAVILKNVPGRTVQDKKFPGAPYGLKMACGENPKRVYGSKGRTPATRMGNVFGYRKAWIDAQEYRRKWDDYRRKLADYKAGKGDKAPDAPKRDLQMDTLAGVLDGSILVQNHCYRADEMAQMIDISHEFGFHIAMFHHGSEAYKIADILKKEDICVATWGEWWGFKMEAYDGIEENAALLQKAGVCTVIHSDDDILTQHLVQEATIALAAGRRMGIQIDEAEAIKWVTANPAKSIGVLDKTGTLEAGKMGDVVLWSADPFSVYATADQVFIDGALVYDRHDPAAQPKSDFELGQTGPAHPGPQGVGPGRPVLTTSTEQPQ